MGFSKYIVDDKNKIKYEISRNVREEEIDTIYENMKRIQEDYNKIWDISEDKLSDKDKHYLFDIGFAMYDNMVVSMPDYFDSLMLMLWYRNRDMDYRVISEFDLDKKDEPAKDYVNVSMWS